MSKQVRLRRGTTAQHATFAGADGEVTFDTTKKCLVLHDGATPGGKPVEGWVKLDPGGPLVVQTLSGVVSLTGGSSLQPALSVAGRAGFNNATVDGWLDVLCLEMLTQSLAYAATVSLDFAAHGWKDLALAGNVTFVTSNLGLGRRVLLRLIGDGSVRSLTFPGGWRWVGGAAPASLAANKVALLDLTSWSGADAGVVARYLAES